MIFDNLRSKAGDPRAVAIGILAEMFGGSSTSGVAVTPNSAMFYAVAFACVRVLAESVGQLPIHLYRANGRTREKATDHPLYRLIHERPNEFQTTQEFHEQLVMQLALRGNFYAFKNRGKSGGAVRELLPFMPGAVTPVQAGWSTMYEVRYSDGKTDILDADQVFRVQLMGGLSPVAQAKEAIGLGMATERHGSKLFSNGARPGGVLSTDKKLSPDTVKRLREDWSSRHEGTGNAHRTAILEEGLKWTATAMTADDAQFLETRKYQRSEVCGIWRVPPHMIGDLERATFSNIEHQGLEFVTQALMPYLVRIEQRYSASVIQEPGVYAKFNVNSLLRGDMKSRSQFYTQMLQAGALSPNEIREFEDMNPREGGDVWLTPMNLTPDPSAGKD